MFKEGDKVKCIDTTDVSMLVLDKEYIVVGESFLTSDGEMVKIQVGSSRIEYYAWRFIKVSDAEEDDLYI